MKAIDYYKQFIAENPKTKDEYLAAANRIFIGLNKEAKELIKIRKVRCYDAVRGIVRELNNKWNAFIGIFEKEHNGLCPFARDDYWRFWSKEIPELNM